jgi:phage terminase large subunit GpA-like protein
LAIEYLNANAEFERTGSETALQTFYNTSLSQPYIPKKQELERLPEVLMDRSESFEELHVHPGVRFLVACVDVQRSRFVVQIHGIGPGTPYDITVVDRFNITKSNRIEYEDQYDRIRPGTYVEDWELLVDKVMAKTYPLDDQSGRRMEVKLTVCDSGGEDGVTTKAYEFYRNLRRRGLHTRFHLLKGNTIPTAPRAYIDYPDARQKSKFSAARGDVPVLFLNSNLLKDALNHRLDSLTPGKGMIRFPAWLDIKFYKELCVEHRDERGRWEGTRGIRNESWDLLYYCIGVCASGLLRVETFNWLNPPIWASEWDKNPLVAKIDEEQVGVAKLTFVPPKRYDFTELGKDLA